MIHFAVRFRVRLGAFDVGRSEFAVRCSSETNDKRDDRRRDSRAPQTSTSRDVRIRNNQLYHCYLGDSIEVLMLRADGTSEHAIVSADLRSG
jgi:hypothetical protein